jgi:hypothetical protein
MIIGAYGLFWREDEVIWSPGKGNTFHLYGRRNKNKGTVSICDFRKQAGIYILYGNLGSYYGGLTNNLGRRLGEHTRDDHAGMWDRFSWFGFRRVLLSKDDSGVRRLGVLPTKHPVDSNKVIKDLEAVVLKAMAVQNANDSNFTVAKRWEQIKIHEIPKYGDRL